MRRCATTGFVLRGPGLVPVRVEARIRGALRCLPGPGGPRGALRAWSSERGLAGSPSGWTAASERALARRLAESLGACGLAWPAGPVDLELSPYLAGPELDLAVAVAVLGAAGLLDAARAARTGFVGSLGPDGRSALAPGVLAAAERAGDRAGLADVFAHASCDLADLGRLLQPSPSLARAS